MKLSIKNNKKFILLLIVLIPLLIFSIYWYRESTRDKEDDSKRKSTVVDVSDMDIITNSYNYIFDSVIDKADYESDPIRAINSGVMVVEDENVYYMQETWSTARLWDFIFASYLFGRDANTLTVSEESVKSKEYFFKNALPFNQNLKDNLKMSNNLYSVCYPLKYTAWLEEEEKAFFIEACARQYSDPDWLLSDCLREPRLTMEDLENLFVLIKSGDNDGIKAFVEKFSLQAADLSDKSVDFFILKKYKEDVRSSLYDVLSIWSSEEYASNVDFIKDYERFQAFISDLRNISAQDESLDSCLDIRIHRSFASTLLYLYENRVESAEQATESSQGYGFDKAITFSMISTLQYMKKEGYSSDIYEDLTTFLVEEIPFYTRRYDYYHGLEQIALLEMCFYADNSDVLMLYEFNETLSGGTIENCIPYERVLNILDKGYCLEKDSCYKNMLFDEPYTSEDGRMRFSASSSDTMRIIFDLLIMRRKNEN